MPTNEPEPQPGRDPDQAPEPDTYQGDDEEENEQVAP